FDGQIAHEIVGTNRHHPTAHSFDQHMLNPTLKSVKSSEDTLDIDVHLLGKAAHNRRCRRLQPDWINFVNRQAVTAGREQKLCVSTISATDRFHSGAAGSR